MAVHRRISIFSPGKLGWNSGEICSRTNQETWQSISIQDVRFWGAYGSALWSRRQQVSVWEREQAGGGMVAVEREKAFWPVFDYNPW